MREDLIHLNLEQNFLYNNNNIIIISGFIHLFSFEEIQW